MKNQELIDLFHSTLDAKRAGFQKLQETSPDFGTKQFYLGCERGLIESQLALLELVKQVEERLEEIN